MQKWKCLKILGPKMSYLGISGLKLETNTVIFQISVLQFAKLQTLVQKWKVINLGPEMHYLGILSYLKSVPSKFSKKKVCWKIKALSLGPKKLYSCIFRLEFENSIVINILVTSQYPQVFLITKEQNCLNLEPKTPCLARFKL